jgi:hypothetical protein
MICNFGINPKPDLFVRVLATTKQNGELNLVAVTKKLLGSIQLDTKVVVVRAGAHPDFLRFSLLGFGLGLMFFLGLLVLPLAVVHDATHRRIGIGRDFDQVQIALLGHLDRLVCLDQANLLVLVVNQSDGGDTDALVGAQSFGRVLLFCLKASSADDQSPINPKWVGSYETIQFELKCTRTVPTFPSTTGPGGCESAVSRPVGQPFPHAQGPDKQPLKDCPIERQCIPLTGPKQAPRAFLASHAKPEVPYTYRNDPPKLA